VRIALGFVAAAMAFCVGSVAAEEHSATPPPDAREAVVCRTVPPATGSRLGARKLCLTQSQWDQQRANDREATEEAHRHSLTAKPPGT
jgi:hypothetical protein